MHITIVVLRMLVRLLGVIQILLGLAIWFGAHASGMVAVHMAIGSVFVLALWILALIALFALPARRVPLFTLLWGALTLWFGMAQTTMLVGAAHWIIRVIHLLIGGAAIGLGESVAKRVLAHRAAQAQAASP